MQKEIPVQNNDDQERNRETKYKLLYRVRKAENKK